MKKIVFLMFHSISKEDTSLSVSPEKLEEVILFFLIKKYTFKNVFEIEKEVKSNSVFLTFDDGYKDNFTILLPILKKYNIPATVYISTNFIGKNFTDSSGNIYDMMNEKDLVNLSQSQLIEIGAHSVMHKNLSNLTKDEQKNEIFNSINFLENLIDKKVVSFAYPRGKYNSDTLQILSCETQIKYALAVNEGLYFSREGITDLEIKRINITNKVSKVKLYMVHYGLYNFYIDLKKGVKKCFHIFLKK